MKLYKGDKIMQMVDKDQVDICLDAGWSKEAPEVEEVELEDLAAKEELEAEEAQALADKEAKEAEEAKALAAEKEIPKKIIKNFKKK